MIKILKIWFKSYFLNSHYWYMIYPNNRIGIIHYSKKDAKRLEGGIFNLRKKIDYKSALIIN